jgi:hypothetical protein
MTAGGLSLVIPTGKMVSYIVTTAANASSPLMLKLEKIETGFFPSSHLASVD